MSRSRPAGRRRRASAAVLAVACLGLGVIAVSATDDGLVYYRTPTEVAGDAAGSDVVRVGGLVVQGSVVESTAGSSLWLTDGATDVPVEYHGRFPDVVQEGQGAVVEGRFDSRGVLQAEELLLRHSNEYRGAEDSPP